MNKIERVTYIDYNGNHIPLNILLDELNQACGNGNKIELAYLQHIRDFIELAVFSAREANMPELDYTIKLYL